MDNSGLIICGVLLLWIVVSAVVIVRGNLMAARMARQKPPPSAPVYQPPAIPQPGPSVSDMEVSYEYLTVTRVHASAGENGLVIRALDQDPQRLPFPLEVDDFDGWLKEEGWEQLRSTRTTEGTYEYFRRPRRG